MAASSYIRIVHDDSPTKRYGKKVTEEVANISGVHCAVNYKYMCSEPGNRDAIVR